MAMKQKGRKIYRTAQGKQIDLDLLIKKNEMTPAVGNARVNARGDELGPGGKIIRKREEVVQEYYNSAPVVNEKSQKNTTQETAVSTEEQKMLDDFDDGWEEDDDGNFVQKGK
jgi:hypothetical protein